MTGCGSKNDIIPEDPTTPITVVTKYKKCPEPDPPVLKNMDNSTHIGSKKNLVILLDNLNDLNLYLEQLENTIDCYIKQTKEDK